ncbi:hypothetical protein E1B28_007778 [Marasmius oreades]|uniref:Uncharacterized protein n=1 Tax=Marasmius oreades TaxID=181124 RepID=A0A9P7S443_9AGAR|nr:uncharacterized protein E1B28_007778 [Marasmius oreades]KAG7094168.1 hypothetical protein E1B28_007778 [Marasmius oreades]
MSQPVQLNFGDTISRGIQNVAALLPLLGTDQCERHVGAALEKGYIYAAATPLSIFGSLGIVKTAFATFLACTTKVFYGGKWFHHAGFGTTASVTSMVTIASGTKLYGAELKFQELLKEQHLDDPGLVTDVEWFGWEKRSIDNNNSQSQAKWFSTSWTFALVSASAFCAAISLLPYIYLNQNQFDHPLSWIFPVFRSFGSMLCVISVQLALQHRIHRIVKSTLLLMKASKVSTLSYDVDRVTKALMEARLRTLRSELKGDCREKGRDAETQERLRREVESLLSVDVMLLLHQVSILAGMVMTVAGYVGCFNLVSQSRAKHGPYVWLGMEAFLSILRMVLWGGNPRWAQGDTGLEMKLNLRSVQGKEASLPDVTCRSKAATSIFPLITTPLLLSQLICSKPGEPRQPFVAVSLEDFLTAATPYVGPLRRLELEGISLFLAIIPEKVDGRAKRKVLCLTARQNDSHWTSISVIVGRCNVEHTIYSSRSRDLRGSHSHSIQLILEEEATNLHPDSAAFIHNRTTHLIVEYSFALFRRLFVHNPLFSIQSLWTLTLPMSPSLEGTLICDVLLTQYDERYISLRQVDDLKVKREPLHPSAFLVDPSEQNFSYLVEYGVLFVSAVLEIHLCVEEHRFIRSMGLTEAISRPLAWDWIWKMGERVSSEKTESRKRIGDKLTESIDVEETWDSLSRELRSLRQMRGDSWLIQSWEGFIDAILGQSGHDSPNILKLFQFQPFSVLQHLTLKLRPLFTDDDGAHTQAYHNIIAYVRSSLDNLHDDKLSMKSKYHTRKVARDLSGRTLVNGPRRHTQANPLYDEAENISKQ